MIAVSLACQQPLSRLLDFFDSPEDFFEPFSNMPFLQYFCKYSNKKAQDRLRKHLHFQDFHPDDPLSKLKKSVLITAFQLQSPKLRWEPALFSNLFSHESIPSLADAITRSSSAPIFFPSHQGYVDGAVSAQNPSTVALSTACDQTNGAAQDLKDIRLASFGSGFFPNSIHGQPNWGSLSWLNPFNSSNSARTPRVPLFSMLMDGSIYQTEQDCQRFLGEHYLRIDPILEERIELDARHKLDYLSEYALTFPQRHPQEWEHALLWFKTHFYETSKQEVLENKLQQAFSPTFLEIRNESHRHKRSPDLETHFHLIIVSQAFENTSLLKRHRLIHNQLHQEIPNIHALSIQAHTPKEWGQGKKSKGSPPCLGKS